MNSFSFSEQAIDNNGEILSCYIIHKRKSVKRLDKNKRLVREVKTTKEQKVTDPAAEIEPRNPFKPFDKE